MRDPQTGNPLSGRQKQLKARNLLKKKYIRRWLEYLRGAKPEEIIEQTYMDALAFGEPREAMHAADKFLQSQFAGKEVAEIFLETLKLAQAEIVVPFKGREDSVKL